MTDLSKEGDTLGYPALIPEHDKNEVLYLHLIAEGLISKVHRNQRQIQILEKLRHTLLPKLMSGEVRVEV